MIDQIKHDLGTASSRVSSALKLLDDKDFMLDESNEVFNSLRSMREKLSELMGV